MKNNKENHGKVGDALHVKMTIEKFNSVSKNNNTIPNKTVLSTEELEKFGASSCVPFVIDEDTQGDYEVVCENDIEVHYHNE